MTSASGRLLILLLFSSLDLVPGFDASTVSFQPSEGTAYDTKPKIGIKGTGFMPMSAEVDLLELELDPPMAKSDYKASVKDDGLITLELETGKTWPTFEGSTGTGTLLTLLTASFKDNDLMDDPIPIAKVFPTPTVSPSTNIVYLTVTPYMTINGTNFDTKRTSLFFSPPLADGQDVRIKPITSTKIRVDLVYKSDGSHRWAEEPGPLKLTGIDTGAGVLKLRTDLSGVTIAELQADLKYHGIKVQAQGEINIYQSAESLTIFGSGFNPEETKFRFGNGIRENENFTAEVTEESAVLSLLEGSKWKLNAAPLPSELLLLAADAGDGWVPVGPNSAKAGRAVATVFEDPRVEESSIQIRRSMTHELVIKGTGFTPKFPPIFVFEPRIEKENLLSQVMNRTHVKLSLVADAGWMAEGQSGNLSVTNVNTGAGMWDCRKPVKVAEVLPDPETHESGIDVEPNYKAMLYQSSDKPLVLDGKGFPDGFEIELSFSSSNEPADDAITAERVSETRLKLSLAEGHTWAPQGGPLFLRAITFGQTKVDFITPGVKIATILEDPKVDERELLAYASHTKEITIKGSGFVSDYDPSFIPRVVLEPTPPRFYQVMSGTLKDTMMTLKLNVMDDEKPMWAQVTSSDEKVSVKVISIDTGAGPVTMPGGGIVIASVGMDDEDYICDDSCVSAKDGVCDEDQGVVPDNDSEYSASRSEGMKPSATSLRREFAGNPHELLSASESEYSMRMSGCEIGTDCSDCGLTMASEGKCLNTCMHARDGSCDDRRGHGVCADGTDCQDCGPWGERYTNFTTQARSVGSSTTVSGDDMSFTVNNPDDPIFAGQADNAKGRYHRVFAKHPRIRKEPEGGEILLMNVLWVAIVLVGVVASGFMLLFIFRCMKGERVELPIPTNPDVEGRR